MYRLSLAVEGRVSEWSTICFFWKIPNDAARIFYDPDGKRQLLPSKGLPKDLSLLVGRLRNAEDYPYSVQGESWITPKELGNINNEFTRLYNTESKFLQALLLINSQSNFYDETRLVFWWCLVEPPK